MAKIPELNPYIDSTLCAHVSGADDKGSGFALWPGEARPADADAELERIPFNGDVYQEIVSEGFDSDGHQTALLQIVRFQMTGKHPDLGTLDISLDTSRPGGVANLRAVKAGQRFPVVHTTRLNVIATTPTLPGVVLQNKGAPLEFVSEPSPTWPPENTIYRLGVPVVFEDRGKPGHGAVTASEGSVTVSSLSRAA
jgi:hypothetical protein